MDALILAAGNGDRFQSPTHDSKLLHPFLGKPLLLRTIDSAYAAGIRRLTIVVGYQADRIRALVDQRAPGDVTISFAFNPQWHLENGLSVLAARDMVASDRFAVLMGDHVFEPAMLRNMLKAPLADDQSMLAIDARPVAAEVAAEATKVRRSGSRIVEIGKGLRDYDALDTGLFICSSNLFAALDTASKFGDTTLSGGVRQLAARGLMRGIEIGDVFWCNIDSMSDLQAAERAAAAAAASA